MKLLVHYRNTITVCHYNLWTLLLMTYSPRAITTRNSCERVKQHLYINTKSEALKWLDKCPCVEQQTSTLLLAAHRPIWRVVCSSFTWQKMLPFYGWQHIYSEHTWEQVATVLTAKCHMAATTCRITLVYIGYCLYFTMDREMPLKIAPSPAGNQGPHLVHCSFSSSQHPKRDIAQLTVVTDGHIHKPHYICSTAMRHASCALHTNAT